MTNFEVIPIAPPSLGDVLADPGAYQAWALTVSAPHAPRHARRARRGAGRRMAVRAAVLAVAGLAVMGCAGWAHAAERPSWDGRTPHVWVGQDPMCWRGIAGRHGWARTDRHGPRFRVVCQRDGGEFAWGIQ